MKVNAILFVGRILHDPCWALYISSLLPRSILVQIQLTHSLNRVRVKAITQTGTIKLREAELRLGSDGMVNGIAFFVSNDAVAMN
jgi:hypothetical protein